MGLSPDVRFGFSLLASVLLILLESASAVIGVLFTGKIIIAAVGHGLGSIQPRDWVIWYVLLGAWLLINQFRRSLDKE